MIQTQATWFLIIELCWLSWSLDLYLVVPRRSMSLKRREASLLSSAKCRRSWDKRCPTRRATIESWVNGPNTMLSECCLGPPVFFFCPYFQHGLDVSSCFHIPSWHESQEVQDYIEYLRICPMAVVSAVITRICCLPGGQIRKRVGRHVCAGGMPQGFHQCGGVKEN